jgi:hypothetical protein
MIITDTIYLQDLVAGVNNAVKATINGQVFNIPMDTSNRHYAEILKQVAEGTLTIKEAD